ncbi:hypothetical protein HRS9139_01232 [Pyrenophora teres f. teres]|nr:hypothetical protein HRS9139_01232 [Pyrenophora teres f. teres]
MKLPTILLLQFAAVAIACGDNAYRCVGPNGVGDDWAKTNHCCVTLAQDTCYCSHMAETYCDPDGSNIENFKDCCGSFQGYEAREC